MLNILEITCNCNQDSCVIDLEESLRRIFFWGGGDVMLCSVVDCHQYFRGTRCLYLQSRRMGTTGCW
jgi:hypothetical protein